MGGSLACCVTGRYFRLPGGGWLAGLLRNWVSSWLAAWEACWLGGLLPSSGLDAGSLAAGWLRVCTIEALIRVSDSDELKPAIPIVRYFMRSRMRGICIKIIVVCNMVAWGRSQTKCTHEFEQQRLCTHPEKSQRELPV